MPSSDSKLNKIYDLLQQLVAIQLYRGGATQQDIADNFGLSIGKVNSMVKGLKVRKGSNAKAQKTSRATRAKVLKRGR